MLPALHQQGSRYRVLGQHAAATIRPQAVALSAKRTFTSNATGADIATVDKKNAAEASPAGSRRQMMLLAGCACCSSLFAGLQPSKAQASEGFVFSYGEEAGPLAWGGTCSTGTLQSPINLPSRSSPEAARSCSSQPPLAFKYNKRNTVRVKNTGTTIQVQFEPGNTVTWGDAQLELLQYHFHTPSEHAFDGQRAAMEVHLVHKNQATGGFAVLGVLMEPPKGPAARPNPCLAAALSTVPQEPQTDATCPTSINPTQLLPRAAAAQQYVHYTGSLTTPPCSEQVDWLVWEQPLPVTEKQVLDFMLFTGAGKTYGHNSRPLQPTNGRPLDYNCLSTA